MSVAWTRRARASQEEEGTRQRGRKEACARVNNFLTPEGFQPRGKGFFSESLILAQNERWQRGLGMQVERASPSSNVGGRQRRKGEEYVGNPPAGWGQLRETGANTECWQGAAWRPG